MTSKQIPSRDGERITEPTHIPTAPTVESQSQHTAGPWQKARHRDGLFVVGDDELGSVVCEVREYVADERAESHANARLIIAAPDMLAAIKAFLAQWEVVEPAISGLFALQFARTNRQYAGPNISAELDALKAALALAEGQ